MKKLSVTSFTVIAMGVVTLIIAQTSSDNSVAPPISPVQLTLAQPNVSQMFSSELSLTDAQNAQLQIYFNVAQPQLDQIHQQARDAGDAILTQLEANVRPLLTSEQQAKLDQLRVIPQTGTPRSAVFGANVLSQ
ncbi:MAG TPA: hypothetical protein VLK27_13560 [Chthoniobacterales bacterium]|nr:hypothetical protein [Chthoniobacterales bacterium]